LNAYEGMFVIDIKEIRKDSNEAEEMIEGLIKKSGGEVAMMNRWDERKMAYDIKGRDVGFYMLTYFEGGPDVVRKLTRECQLSTVILRSLCFKIKEIPAPDAFAEEKEEPRAADAAEAAAKAPAEAAAPAAKTDAPAAEGTTEPADGPPEAEKTPAEAEAASAESAPDSGESEETQKTEEDK